MLDLSSNTFKALSAPPSMGIAISVLIISMIGSTHCAGMCGPLVSFSTQGIKKKLVFYHLGRIISYIIIGALSGYLGQQLLNEALKPLAILAGLFIALYFILFSFKLFFPENFSLLKITSNFTNHFTKTITKTLFSQLQKVRNKECSSILFGLLTPVLPCGWLYSFVIASMTVKDPLWAAILMMIFAIGSIPALSLSSVIFQKGTGNQKSIRYLSASIFLFLGLWSLYSKTWPLLTSHGTTNTNFNLLCF